MMRIPFYHLFLITLCLTTHSLAGPEAAVLTEREWSFQGIFGTFDRAALQRGFQVYKEVCASCHGFNQRSYRHLQDIGYDLKHIKALAATYETRDGPNEDGEMFMRPAEPNDKFVNPYANTKAARAVNNGALPVDLSLVVKARKGGPDYLYGLLTGFSAPPAHMKDKILDGMHYNAVFPGNQIAMAAPLSEGLLDYQDGTKATVSQMAEDVTTFLAWTAEPELEYRKKWGFRILIFLLAFSGVMFGINARVWRRLSQP